MIANGALVPLPRDQLAAIAPNWNAMRTAIVECERYDEVRELSDKAMALRAYYAQSRDTDNELSAMRVRLRAERRLGELIDAEQKAGRIAGRGGNGSNQYGANVSGRDISTLADAGIPRNRSAMAQTLARVPEDQFEAALATGKPSARSIARLAPPREYGLNHEHVAHVQQQVDVQAVLKTWGMVRDFAAAVKDESLLPPLGWATHPGIQLFQIEEITSSIPVIQRYLSKLEELRNAGNAS